MSQPKPPTAQPQTAEEVLPSSDLGPILVIIPTYNESENIARIVSRIRSAVPAAHILVADDGSPDGTGEIADKIAAADDHVHVMHRPARTGSVPRTWPASRGVERGYDVVVEMDADGSHQPEQLPRLLEALGRADVVLGSRWVPGGGCVNWPAHRDAALARRQHLHPARPRASRCAMPPVATARSARTALRGLDLDEVASQGYCFQVDLAWRAVQRRLRVVEVPITFVERECGDSKMSQRIVARGAGSNHNMGSGLPGQAAACTCHQEEDHAREGSCLMRLRHGWPMVLLVVMLVAIPILEVWLLIKVGQQIGLLPTVLILIAQAIIGALLMRHEGSRAWKALNDAFTKGRVPTGELADAALILVGGVLLMLPGFLTDILGFVFLLRWTRPVARKIIAFFVARRINRLGIPVMRARMDTDNLIEGETVDQTPADRSTPGDPISSREKSRNPPNQPSRTSPALIWVPRR